MKSNQTTSCGDRKFLNSYARGEVMRVATGLPGGWEDREGGYTGGCRSTGKIGSVFLRSNVPVGVMFLCRRTMLLCNIYLSSSDRKILICYLCVQLWHEGWMWRPSLTTSMCRLLPFDLYPGPLFSQNRTPHCLWFTSFLSHVLSSTLVLKESTHIQMLATSHLPQIREICKLLPRGLYILLWKAEKQNEQVVVGERGREDDRDNLLPTFHFPTLAMRTPLVVYI